MCVCAHMLNTYLYILYIIHNVQCIDKWNTLDIGVWELFNANLDWDIKAHVRFKTIQLEATSICQFNKSWGLSAPLLWFLLWQSLLKWKYMWWASLGIYAAASHAVIIPLPRTHTPNQTINCSATATFEWDDTHGKFSVMTIGAGRGMCL